MRIGPNVSAWAQIQRAGLGQFQRRREGRGGGRASARRIAVPSARQERGQVGPVAHRTDQRTQTFQRLLHGEDAVAVHDERTEVIAGADTGVALHQVQQRGRPHDLARPLQPLRLAACEDVAAQLVAGHQTGGGPAHRLQPLQLESQMRGQILGRRSLLRRVGRQQQTGFEEGEPGRHHQIVGGQFQPQRPRMFDERRDTAGPAAGPIRRRRSTFCVRASVSSTSSGPSKPSTSTISASAARRAATASGSDRAPGLR